MCRKIVIECKWGDEDPQEEFEDAGVTFDRKKDYDALEPYFEMLLRRLMDNHFFGGYEIKVEPL